MGRTFEPGVEYLPAPGYFHVEGDPVTADRALTVRFFGPDGQVGTVVDEFAVGDVVRFDRTDHPGQHGLTVNGMCCTGAFGIEPGRETDVLLRVADGRCDATAVRIHDEGEMVHQEVAGLIRGHAPVGAIIIVSSAEDPPRRVPVTVAVDESGAFETAPLPAGRYRLDVRIGGAIHASATVDVVAGESEDIDLSRSSNDPGTLPTPGQS